MVRNAEEFMAPIHQMFDERKAEEAAHLRRVRPKKVKKAEQEESVAEWMIIGASYMVGIPFLAAAL